MIESLRPFRLALAGGLLLLSPVLPAATRTTAPARHTVRSTAAPARAGAETPEAVVDAFLKAEANGDDEKAYAYLSSGAKAKTTLKDWASRAHQVRGTFSAITLVAGEALLIGGGVDTANRVNPPTFIGPARDHATVKIVQMLPIPDTLQLVKENGGVIDIQKTLGAEEAPAKPSSPTPPPPPVQPTAPTPPDTSLQCQYSLRQVGQAFRVYALDHNGLLPSAATWTDDLAPYLQSPNLLKCPPDSNADSSYAMNASLSGMKLIDIANPETRVLLYETTTTAKNVSGHGETQPAKPHPSGYLVLFVNGDSVFRTAKPVVQ